MSLASRKAMKFVLETKAGSVLSSALLRDDTIIFLSSAEVFSFSSIWSIAEYIFQKKHDTHYWKTRVC
ncbi:hypothetical protein HU200_055326 [Digitaria exilis]|uniref:Uncharacterized protein n=1 Tax=Digitaria exilis TaxID=1010633 RepID=A0A835E653_9POAL|nr:hypothetical protein HU200_055326 [Digitaria exilis]